MSTKHFAGLVGLGFSVLLAACTSPAQDDEAEGSTSAASTLCTESSDTPCTPAVGSELRKEVTTLLRFSAKQALAKDGVPPADRDITFVYETMKIQKHRVYVAGSIMGSDGKTPFDLRGTPREGESNTIQALIDLSGGVAVTPRIGGVLDPKALSCEFVKAAIYAVAPNLYSGNMQHDCEVTRATQEVDDNCFLDYVHGANACTSEAGSDDDAVFEACFAPVKKQLETCCATGGGSPTCATP